MRVIGNSIYHLRRVGEDRHRLCPGRSQPAHSSGRPGLGEEPNCPPSRDGSSVLAGREYIALWSLLPTLAISEPARGFGRYRWSLRQPRRHSTAEMPDADRMAKERELAHR